MSKLFLYFLSVSHCIVNGIIFFENLNAMECPFSGKILTVADTISQPANPVLFLRSAISLSKSVKSFLQEFQEHTKTEQDQFLGFSHLYNNQPSRPFKSGELLIIPKHKHFDSYETRQYVYKLLSLHNRLGDVDFLRDTSEKSLSGAVFTKNNGAAEKDTILIHEPLYKLLYHALTRNTPYTHVIEEDNLRIEIAIPRERSLEMFSSIFEHELHHTLQPPTKKNDCSWGDTAKNSSSSALCLATAAHSLSKLTKTKSKKWGSVLAFSVALYPYFIKQTFNKSPIKDFKPQKYYEWDADEGVTNNITRLEGAILKFKISQILMCYTESSEIFAFLIGYKRGDYKDGGINKSDATIREELVKQNPKKAYYYIYGKNSSHPSHQERIDRYEERKAELIKAGHQAQALEPAYVKIFDKTTDELMKEYTL